MPFKYFSFKVDADSVTEAGEFSGYASTFGNKDQGGDIVMPGAFDAWLSVWNESGDPLPLLWQHDGRDPRGVLHTLTPDAKGLFTKGQVNMNTEAGRDAREYLIQKAVTGFSIGYDIYPGGIQYDPKQDAYLLTNIELWEVSLATFPMNRSARIETVKSVLTRGGEPTLRDIERALREIGYSGKQAKVIAKTASETLGVPDDTHRDGDLDESEATTIKERLDALMYTKGSPNV
jgi:HK97 family phage prohead protease